MDDIQREALKNNTTALVQDIVITKRFLAALEEKKIFEQEMLEMIKVESTTSDKVYKLLDLLPRRGPEAFKSFLLVLEDQYGWLATKLCDTVQELTNQRTSQPQPGQSDVLASPENSILDLDIKQRISSFIQRQFGQVRRISNTDKSSIERWIGEWVQEEQRRLMQILQKAYESGDERILEKPIIKEKLYKLHTKLASAADRSNKNGTKFGVWTIDTISFEAIEEHISTITRQFIEMVMDIDQCYNAFGAKPKGGTGGLITYVQSMLALIKDKDKEIAHEKENVAIEKQKAEEIVADLYNNVSEQKKKDQFLLQYQNQIKELNQQVKSLREENNHLEFQITNLDTIHAEKEKTLGELRQHNADMQVLVKILRDENQDLKVQKMNTTKATKHRSPNRGMNATRYQKQSRLKQNIRKKANFLNENKT